MATRRDSFKAWWRHPRAAPSRRRPAPAARPAPPAPARKPAPEPESVPPWEASGGSDIPPWEDLPPDLPVFGPYDNEPVSLPPKAAAPARASKPEAAAPEAPRPRPVAKAVPPRPPAAAEDGTPPVFTGEWPTLAASLSIKGLAQQLAYQSELTQVVGRTFHLRIPVAAIGENGVAERLQQVLSDHFGVPVRVQCEIGAVSETAAAADAQARAERQREAEANIEADPFVQGLLRDFGGQIVPGSIQHAWPEFPGRAWRGLPSVFHRIQEHSIMMKGQLAGLMKQAQQMQENMKKMQEQLALIEVEGQSGAGLVKVVMTCKNDVKRVTIDPSLLADDKELLEDLVAAAFNDAVRKAEATTQEKMGSMTSGLPLPPGFKLPF